MSLRLFRVCVGNAFSQYYVQENGVPQGSVLSVILFAITINAIVAAVRPAVVPSLYVDDLALHFSSERMAVAERQLQQAINRVDRWALQHNFRFSAAKTSVVHFCGRRILHPEPEFHLKNSVLPVVDTYKFLGLYLDKRLTWQPHIRQLKVACKKRLNTLKFLSSTSWGG